MPRSWENERTVTSVLQNAGFYPTENKSKEQLQAEYIEERDVQIGGKSYRLDRMSKYDVKVFADELDGVLSRTNPFLWDLYAKFAQHCLTAVQLVNNEHNQGFRGAAARGNEMDVSLLNARQFSDPDSLVPGTRRTSWRRVVAAAGTLNFMTDTTLAAALTLTEEECLIFLGWYNPAEEPISDMYQYTLNTDLFDWQDMDFEKVHLDKGEVLIESKEPWILPPEESGLIQTRYIRIGTDELRPIGLWVKEARNMRAMATP